MSGYPNYPYSSPPPSQPYYDGAPPPSNPYGAEGGKPNKPPKENKPASAGYGGYPTAPPTPYGGYAQPQLAYGASPGGYGATLRGSALPGGYGAAPGGSALPGGYGAAPGGYPPAPAPYGSPFAALVPSAFPPGTDPNVVACFQAADADGSGFIDDKELQRALSSYNQSFSLRTVHLLMYLFTNSNVCKIGLKEFTSVFYSLQNWRSIFERADRDRSGKIDTSELRDALMSLGFAVSPVVLDLLVSKFDKSES